MTVPVAYFNGRFVPFTEAGLPLHDAGFVFGATVVDNARTFRHKLYRWPDHLERFRRDCRACYVPLQESDERLTEVAAELLARNAKHLPPNDELQLVTFATPGPLGFYLGEATNGPPTLGMVTYSLPFVRFRRFFTEGVTLALAGVQSAETTDLVPPRVKHRSRLFWRVAERTINDLASPFHNPGAIPVVMNQHGAGDTAIGAILAVADDRVLRPVPGTVLESISAKVVGELCKDVGLQVEDVPLDLRCFCRPPEPGEEKSIVPRVSELLLVGSGFCLAGVRRFAAGLRGRDYVWPGPVYQKLLARWSEAVGVDVAGQIMGTR